MGALTVERFAAIRASLDAGQARASLLATHGLDDATWGEEQERILSDLADAAEQADWEKLLVYQRGYRAAWRSIVGDDPVLPDLAPSTARPPAPPATSGGTCAEAREEAPAGSGARPDEKPLGGGSPGRLGVPIPASKHRAPAELAGTSLGFVAPLGPALPFAPGAARGPTAEGAMPPAPAPASTTQPTPQQRPPAELAGTSLGFVAPLGPALPFAKHAPPSTPSGPVPLAPVATPPPAPRHRPPAQLTGTSLAFVAPKGPALPFGAHESASQDERGKDAPGATPSATLSLEQYASFCVELAVDPIEEDVLRRYRLTPDWRRALDAHWQARLEAEPNLRVSYDRAYGAYEKWYRASRTT